MKARYLTLAAYIFALALFPCNDSETCIDEVWNGFSLVNAIEHSHSSRELDICTPFCICSCCAAHIKLSTSGFSIAAQHAHNTLLNTFYIERPVGSISQAIWQPPRA